MCLIVTCMVVALSTVSKVVSFARAAGGQWPGHCMLLKLLNCKLPMAVTTRPSSHG